MANSCVTEKLSRYGKISERESYLLGVMEDVEKDFGAQEQVVEFGQSIEEFYVVKSGWLYSYSLLADGRRQVFGIHYPGDIIGMYNLPFGRAQYALQTNTETTLCPFPRRHFHRILTETPRLSGLLFSLNMVEKAVLFDRLLAVARKSARDRLCHLLLEIRSRLELTNHTEGSRFYLPLSQSVIGDAVGLTNVSVSRCLTELEGEGLIRRDGRYFEFDRDEVAARIDFEDRFAQMNTSWFEERPQRVSPSQAT